MSANSRDTFPTLKQPAWDSLAGWVGSHQTGLFFALTFLFSWAIYAALSVVSFENETTYRRILGISGFGPALSAILLSWISAGRTRRGDRQRIPAARMILLSLGLFILVAGIEWWNNAWWRHAFDASLLLADAVFVALATSVTLWLVSGQDEKGCRRLGIPRGWVAWVWVTLALVLWPVLILTDRLVSGVLGGWLSSAPTYPDLPLAPLVVQSFLWALFFGGPLGEEPGWRGFALPRLQQRFSPLVASIILGALWGLWHVPQHFMGAYGGGAFGSLMRLQEIPLAIVFTWLYNRSKGSLLVVVLLHASINTTGWIIPRSYLVTFVLTSLLAAGLVIKGRMWAKPARLQTTSWQ